MIHCTSKHSRIHKVIDIKSYPSYANQKSASPSSTLSSSSLFPSFFPSFFPSHLFELCNPDHWYRPLGLIQREGFSSKRGLTLTTPCHLLPPHLIRLHLILLPLTPPPTPLLIPLHSTSQHLFPQLHFQISHSRSLPSVSGGGHTFAAMTAIILSRCFLRKEARAASLLLLWSEIACSHSATWFYIVGKLGQKVNRKVLVFPTFFWDFYLQVLDYSSQICDFLIFGALSIRSGLKKAFTWFVGFWRGVSAFRSIDHSEGKSSQVDRSAITDVTDEAFEF